MCWLCAVIVRSDCLPYLPLQPAVFESRSLHCVSTATTSSALIDQATLDALCGLGEGSPDALRAAAERASADADYKKFLHYSDAHESVLAFLRVFMPVYGTEGEFAPTPTGRALLPSPRTVYSSSMAR